MALIERSAPLPRTRGSTDPDPPASCRTRSRPPPRRNGAHAPGRSRAAVRASAGRRAALVAPAPAEHPPHLAADVGELLGQREPPPSPGRQIAVPVDALGHGRTSLPTISW